jgi:hypothetical protein
MAAVLLRAVLLLIIVATSLLAFIFSLLATTSHRWAVRDYYTTVVPEEWTRPNFTISRSPFRICTARPNFEQSTPTAPDEEPTLVLVKYNTTCAAYAPFGLNRTSCELRSVTKTDSVATAGDARLCQQIHLAGNFAISSSVFISLGCLLNLLLSTLTAYQKLSSTSHANESTGSGTRSRNEAKESSNETAHPPSTQPGRNRARRPVAIKSLNLVSVAFLCVGAILALLSQFYGIVGLVQSAPNNADWASSAAGNSKDVDTNIEGYHGPWYQGEGLSVYMTCSWAFALATAVFASRTWSLPRWDRFI